MRLNRTFLAGALVAASVALAGAMTADAQQRRRPAPAAPAPAARQTPIGGVEVGNPAAQVRLVEYVSYTCGHCASYTQQSEAALRTGYIARGTVSVEVRNLVRDPIDTTAASLAHCGTVAGFPRRHAALMRGQTGYFDAINRATPAQISAMGSGATGAQRQMIADKTGMLDIVAALGLPRDVANRCLADPAIATRIEALRQAAFAAGVTGTPSFQINGTLVDSHNWPALQPQLDAAVTAAVTPAGTPAATAPATSARR